MSEENVKKLRRLIDGLNRRDGTVFALLDPDVEMQDYPGLPDAEWHRGHEGAMAWFAKLREVVGEFRLDYSNCFASGEDVVFDWRATGHGRGAGVPINFPGAAIMTFRAGSIIRLQVFANREEALEAAGLSE